MEKIAERLAARLPAATWTKEETKVEIQAKTDNANQLLLRNKNFIFQCYLMMLNVCVLYEVSFVYQYE